MIIYVKMGKVRSMSLEWNREFGGLPLFKQTSYHCETIVDMPYTQIILTSGKWTPTRRAANDKQKVEETSEYSSGTDRDRS
jgi:hypothetical protein